MDRRIDVLKRAAQARRDADWLESQGRSTEAAAERNLASNLDRKANEMPSD